MPLPATLPYLLEALVIFGLDYVTPREITLWALYVVPITLATWNLGRRSGAVIGVASTLLNFLTWLHHLAPKPGLHAAMVLSSHSIIFFVVVFLAAERRAKEVERVFHPSSQ